jgi:hypothetical protein
MSLNSSASSIQLLHENKVQSVALSSDIPANELISCISAMFECSESIIGVKDIHRNIIYPMSVLSTNPTQFSDSIFELIIEQANDQDDSIINSVDLSALPHMKLGLSDKINTIRECLGFEAVDAIQLKNMLSLSSETEEMTTREEFFQALDDSNNKPGKRQLLSILFDVFSMGSDFAMISDVASGLSVLFHMDIILSYF